MGTKRIEPIPAQKTKGHCRWCQKPVPKGRRSWCSEACIHEGRMRSDPGYVREAVAKRDKGICAGCGLLTGKLPDMAAEVIRRVAIIEPRDYGFRVFTPPQPEIAPQNLGDVHWLPYQTWRLDDYPIAAEWKRRTEPLETGFWAIKSSKRFQWKAFGYLRLRDVVAYAFRPHAIWSLSHLSRCACEYCDWARTYHYHPEKHTWEADHIVPVVEGGGGCGLENYRTLCLRCHKAETAKLAARRSAIRGLMTTATQARDRDARRHGDAVGQELLF